jgi:hypothetical protein
MPQTIGSKLERNLRKNQRNEVFSDADDLRLLNEIISKSTGPDPNIVENRELTNDDKKWKAEALNIDNQTLPFAKFILDDDGNVRDDLNLKQINQARNALPDLMKSLYNMSKDGDPKTIPYIEGINMSFGKSLDTAEKNAYREDSLHQIKLRINDLGDEERNDGKWNLPDTKWFLSNIENLQKNDLNADGAKIVDHYQPLIDMLTKKEDVFKSLERFTSKGSSENMAIQTSEKGLANLNAAISIMRYSRNENIDDVKRLLDEIPKFIGANAAEVKKSGMVYEKGIKDKEDKSFDSQIRLQLDNFSKQSEGEDKLDSKLNDVINNYSGVNVPIGDWADEKVQKDALPIFKRQFMDMLVGVDDFNSATWNDESYAEDYDLQDEVDAGNIDRVMVYFTDPSNKNITAEDRNQGITTIGEARIKRIKSGNDDQTKNAQNRFRALLKVITLLDPKVVTDPGLRNTTREDSYRRLEDLGVTIAR